MFDEFDVFRLRLPLPDKSVPIGSVGVVLMVYDAVPRAYEVEFPDGKGGNLGASLTYTLSEQFLELPSSNAKSVTDGSP